MDVQSIMQLGPKLSQFLAQFSDCGSGEIQAHVRTYVSGQVSLIDRKNVEQIALHSGEVPRTLQEFLASYPWDHECMRNRIQQIVARDHATKNSIGIIDETSFAKKSDKTPGVQRQWCGESGKTDNCCVTVHLSYAHDDFQCLIDEDIFLPESWSDDRARCRAAKIPDEVVYRRKLEIALEQHQRATENGIVFDWLTFDEWYGSKPAFLDTLDWRKQAYAGEIPRNLRVWSEEPCVTSRPYRKGSRGRGRQTPRLLANTPKTKTVQECFEQSPVFNSHKSGLRSAPKDTHDKKRYNSADHRHQLTCRSAAVAYDSHQLTIFRCAVVLVSRHTPLIGHGYVSMAGAYLEDCRVLHQAIQISRMYSFDMNKAVLARQELNNPFGFIQCQLQSSKQLVENFDSVRLSLGSSELNVVVWLDYPNPKERRIQLQELGTLMPKLMAGDIVRITLNAHRTTLGENHIYEALIPSEKPLTLAAWRHARLKDQLGEYLPADRDNDEHMETKEGFYGTLIRAVKRVVVGSLEARPELVAFPVLSTAYDDQHGMVTVTCVILRAEEQNEFLQLTRWEDWGHKPGVEWDEFTEIHVPHLSMRERQFLHRMIERGGAFGGGQPTFVSQTEFEQYRTHYLRYPSFAPLDVL